MARIMTKQESYVERRQLFKNIWEASSHINEGDDIMNKPKVIRTLRLDEVEKCPVGKTKKQRIKNLRHVCKKILDFCDKQDADETYVKPISTAGEAIFRTADTPPKKLKKKIRIRKNIKKTKSLFGPRDMKVVRAECLFIGESTADDISNPSNPEKPDKTDYKAKRVMIKQPRDSKPMPGVTMSIKVNTSGEAPLPAPRRKVLKKKKVLRKRKKTAVTTAA